MKDENFCGAEKTKSPSKWKFFNLIQHFMHCVDWFDGHDWYMTYVEEYMYLWMLVCMDSIYNCLSVWSDESRYSLSVIH